MTIDEIQIIIDKAYPKIQDHYNKKYGETSNLDIPKIEMHKDIYARLSGDEEQSGEHSDTSEAQYDDKANVIYIYYPNMINKEHVIRSIIHEYTHYKQDHSLFSKYKAMYDYNEDPTEVAAKENEEDWHLFI